MPCAVFRNQLAFFVQVHFVFGRGLRIEELHDGRIGDQRHDRFGFIGNELESSYPSHDDKNGDSDEVDERTFTTGKPFQVPMHHVVSPACHLPRKWNAIAMPTVPMRPASRRKEAVPVFPSPECAIRRHRVRSLITVHPDAPFGRREEPADRRPSPMVTMLPSAVASRKLSTTESLVGRPTAVTVSARTTGEA